MENQNGSKGMAIASLVLGILGLVTCCIPFLGAIFSILAAIFGIIVLVKKKEGKGLAIAGLICGALGTLIGVRMIVALVAAVDGIEAAVEAGNGLFTWDDYTTNDPVEFLQYILDNIK